MIVKGSDEFQNEGSVQWLETGNDAAGLKHINEQHATEDQFYAIETVESIEDVKDIVYSTMKHGNSHRIPNDEGGGTAYTYQYTESNDVSVVAGDNGFVVTARPGEYP